MKRRGRCSACLPGSVHGGRSGFGETDRTDLATSERRIWSLGMGRERNLEAADEHICERPIESRRDGVSEIRFVPRAPAISSRSSQHGHHRLAPQPTPSTDARPPSLRLVSPPPPTPLRPRWASRGNAARLAGAILAARWLTAEARTNLWEVIRTALFAREDDREPSPGGVTGRRAVRRVWTAAPIGGIAERMPEDVAEVFASWFSLVDPTDVYAFVETVHDSLDEAAQPSFASATNAVLERARSGRRFVKRKLVPIAATG
jgi:hypothetical protein